MGTMQTNRKLVERFHRVLVEEIRQGSPGYLRDSFTVAEIYQSLIPYRTHRDRLGVEINGDYEDTLLRLLSGEGEYLILESEPARTRIRRELEAQSPNTGIYREFAAVGVRLNPIQIPGPGESQGGAETGSDSHPTFLDELSEPDGTAGTRRASGRPQGAGGPAPEIPSVEQAVTARKGSARESAKPAAASAEVVAASAPGAGPEGAGVARQKSGTAAPQRSGASSSAAGRAAGAGDVPSDCPDCRQALPERVGLRYCPHCGANVFQVPCGACGEELERSWRFCFACGAGRD